MDLNKHFLVIEIFYLCSKKKRDILPLLPPSLKWWCQWLSKVMANWYTLVFTIFILWYKFFIESLLYILSRFRIFLNVGTFWKILEILKLFEMQNCAKFLLQKFSSKSRTSQDLVKLIFLHKIENWVSFPISPVLGRSDSCIKSYARLTEEWSVWRMRGSCQACSMVSNDTTLVSIDTAPDQISMSFYHHPRIAVWPQSFPCLQKSPECILTYIIYRKVFVVG